MSYWGIEPDQNDFTFDGVGAYIHSIRIQQGHASYEKE